MTVRKAKGAKRFLFIFMPLFFSFVIAFTGLEIALHLFPKLLPRWYRLHYPTYGIEFFRPGILEKTPIEGLPIPLESSSLYNWSPFYSGPPPNDLEYIGLVKREQNPDPSLCPKVVYYTDEEGFPNRRKVESPDMVFVGDSFTWSMGIASPRGLQSRLEEETGLSVYNLGTPGVGPVQEEWVLNRIGLPRKPKVVFWFVLAANDFENAVNLQKLKKRGVSNHLERLSERPDYPSLFLLDFVRKFFQKGEPEQKGRQPLPGFLFGTQKKVPLWFAPRYLRQLMRTKGNLKSAPGFKIFKDIITRVHAKLKPCGIRLVLVSIPSKPQVYLPYVEKNESLLLKMAFFDRKDTVRLTPERAYQRALSNRSNPDQLIEDFCKKSGISFLALLPSLEKQAKQGELGYFSADSHWGPKGQEAALPPLKDLLRELDML